MSNLPDKLRLKALAEEDIYFAKRDRELIKALHKRKLAKRFEIEARDARKLENEYASITLEHGSRLKKLGRLYRKLIKKVSKLTARKKRR